uniref:C2H2-type domain-containing protein n=1 Tax=Oryza punctata TaxID=4537 RepID=A0A0E0K739_ORYPU
MSVEDKHHLAAGVVKRKRTKRPRHHAAPASSSESTTTEEEDMAHCLILLAQGAAVVDSKPSTPAPPPPPPPAQPPVLAAPAPPPPAVVVKSERYTSRKYTEAATTADGVRAGFYVYECKTCNKCFPTFQALGGHRASHKKPRLAGADDDNANATTNTNTNAIVVKSKPPLMTAPSPPSPPPPQADAALCSVVVPDVTTVLSLNNVAASSMINKLRVHECSICGAEFGSGQALGGHMRRHRPLHAPPERAVTMATTTTAPDTKKAGSTSINLELDLNLPAPSDEESVSPPPPPPPPPPPVLLALDGQFDDGKKPILQLTTSAALVGCHY